MSRCWAPDADCQLTIQVYVFRSTVHCSVLATGVIDAIEAYFCKQGLERMQFDYLRHHMASRIAFQR